jgi:6-phosphogluconolactonase
MPTNTLFFVSGYAAVDRPGIQVLRLDEGSGKLTALGGFEGLRDPSYVLPHPNGRWLYAVSETSQALDGQPGRVAALSFERENSTLRLLNQQPSGGDWPCHLQLDATGRWLFVSNYATGSAGVFPIREEGALGEMCEHVQHAGAGPNKDRQAGPHIHSITLAPDNQLVLMADLGIDQIVLYRLDALTGRLCHSGETYARPGAGPRHMAFHPNSQWVYVTNELDNTLSVFSFEPARPALREIQVVSTIPEGTTGNTLAHVQVSASGQRVYVSNRGHDSLAVFTVGVDGRLAFSAYFACEGHGPRHFTLTPSERFILVANQHSQEVCVLPVSAGTGTLGLPVARLPMAGASCVQVA